MAVDPPGLAIDPVEECEMVVDLTVRRWVNLSSHAEVIHALMGLTNALRLEAGGAAKGN